MNKILKTYESFNPEEYWEEENDIELLPGQKILVYKKDWDSFYEILKNNNYVWYSGLSVIPNNWERFIDNIDKYIFLIETDKRLRRHSLKRLPLPTITHQYIDGKIVEMKKESLTPKIKKFLKVLYGKNENPITEEELELEWDEEEILPNKYYKVNIESWEEFAKLLKIYGYRWRDSGDISNYRPSNNSIIKTYMIGNRKLIVFSNPPNNNNNDLIQFNESFEPEEYWEEEEEYDDIISILRYKYNTDIPDDLKKFLIDNDSLDIYLECLLKSMKQRKTKMGYFQIWWKSNWIIGLMNITQNIKHTDILNGLDKKWRYYVTNMKESFEPEEYWEEEELYKIIENDNDLIQGNIYTVIDKSLRNINGYGLFFMIGRYYGKGYSNNNDHTRGHARFISASNIYFDNNEWSYRDKFGRYIRESTQEEKEWFLKCEKQGKFIPNPKFHINESFEPIEEWEEELSDEIKISEMIVGEIYVMRAEDGKIIFRFDGFNNKVKYHINTKSVIFHLENEDGIEEHKYKDIPVPLIKDDMDEIVYLPSKSEIKEIENYENNINESFEPEEEWDEGFYIIPGKAYLVKKKDWSEFSEILNDNGYKWGGSGEITKDWFVDIYVPDRYSKECVIYPVIINGGIKSITRSSLDYYYDEYSYNKELIKFNGLYESFNPEEEWGEDLPLEYNKIYKIPINHYI